MAPPPTGPKRDPAGIKILVVDDDENIRAMLKTTLTMEGFAAESDRDGRNIPSRAATLKPALIVTDLMMPGGGGYDVLRSLQADDDTRRIPVIVISGANVDPSTVAMMKQEPNFAGFLPKPLRMERLLRTIHATLHTLSQEEKLAQKRGTLPEEQDFGGIF